MEKKQKIMIAIAIIVVILLLILGVFLFLNNKTYTVAFNSEGGTAIESQAVKKGETATEPTEPTKGGYVFLGWYVSETSNEKYDFKTAVEKDIVLIAKWEKAKKEISEVSIITDKKEITVNDELSLSAKVMSGDEELKLEDLEVIWTSSDETIATVDKSGKVKALKAGTVTITVTANGVKSEVEITVKKEEKKEEKTTQTSNNNTTSNKPSTTKPTTKPNTGNNTKPSKPTKPVEPTKPETKVTYTYKWEAIAGSAIDEYMLYIVDSNGKKVAGTATVTKVSGSQATVSIPASGVKYVKSVIASVTNVKAK